MESSPVVYKYDSRSWHTKLFLWSHCMWHIFYHGCSPRRVEQTDICSYIHMFGLGFIALFSQILFWGGVVGVFVILPTHLFGTYGAFKQLAVIASIGIATGVLTGIIGGGIMFFDYLENKNMLRAPYRPSFFMVFRDWVRAKKEKTCWRIAIKYNDDREKEKRDG